MCRLLRRQPKPRRCRTPLEQWPRAGYATPKATGWISPNTAGRFKAVVSGQWLVKTWFVLTTHRYFSEGEAMTTYVGRPLKRFEDPRLMTGQGAFVDDLRLPGMLHAVVLRSPHAHARLLSLDAVPARALPGVVAVLTASDIAGAVRDIPPRPPREFEGIQVPDHPVLARDK